MKYHIIQRNNESATNLRSAYGSIIYKGFVEASNESDAIEYALYEYYSDDIYPNEYNSTVYNGNGRAIWEKGDSSIDEVDYSVVALTTSEFINEYPCQAGIIV